MTKRLRNSLTALLCLALLLAPAIGCSGWERQTYQALSGDKQVLDAAIDDYNNGVIERDQGTALVLEQAKALHNAATIAFKQYWKAKVDAQEALASQTIGESDAARKVNAARRVVIDAMVGLPEIIGAIKKIPRRPQPAIGIAPADPAGPYAPREGLVAATMEWRNDAPLHAHRVAVTPANTTWRLCWFQQCYVLTVDTVEDHK